MLLFSSTVALSSQAAVEEDYAQTSSSSSFIGLIECIFSVPRRKWTELLITSVISKVSLLYRKNIVIISWTTFPGIVALLNCSCNSNLWASCSSGVVKVKEGRAVTAKLYVQCQWIQDGFCSFCSLKACPGCEPFNCPTNAITWTFAMASSKEVPYGINFSLVCDGRGFESSCSFCIVLHTHQKSRRF